MNEQKEIEKIIRQSNLVTAYTVKEREIASTRSGELYFIFIIEMEIMRLMSNDDSTLLLQLTRSIRNIIHPKKRVNFVIEFTV